MSVTVQMLLLSHGKKIPQMQKTQLYVNR